ncbi:MAG: hypothetical protein HFE77_02645 [Clostridiales bacterium]|nr:hypothetical protein [Clostridiales bacterium]
MRKIGWVVLLCCSLLLCACSASMTSKKKEIPESSRMAEITDQREYIAYQDIFYHQNADSFVGKEVAKEGIFTTLQDHNAQINRYYIWGYADSLKSSDWQWEIDPGDGAELPSNGSRVKVSGVFQFNQEKALDEYWIENATIELVQKYTPAYNSDLDLTTMSSTLASVQLLHLKADAAWYHGKIVRLYGRVFNETTLQHPYLDQTWFMQIETNEPMPEAGTFVTVQGELKAEDQRERIIVSFLK